MRYVLIAVMVAALTTTAFGGANPNCKIFVHIEADDTPDAVDNATVVNELLTTTPYQSYYAYIGLTDLGIETNPSENDGLTVASFLINDIVASYPGVVGSQGFESLLPGGLAIGNAFSGGITISGTECTPGPFAIIGVVSLFYLTGGCTIEVLDHTEYPRLIVDCTPGEGQRDYYCVWKNGGLGMAAPAGEAGCEADTPVLESTWSSVKAMFR